MIYSLTIVLKSIHWTRVLTANNIQVVLPSSPVLNLKQIRPGVHGLWSEIFTSKQTDKQRIQLYLDRYTLRNVSCQIKIKCVRATGAKFNLIARLFKFNLIAWFFKCWWMIYWIQENMTNNATNLSHVLPHIFKDKIWLFLVHG